jgi:hypothetical protein
VHLGRYLVWRSGRSALGFALLLLKGRILVRFHAATTPRVKVAAAVAMWVVAAGSKLVVLRLVDVVFGSAVSLGGFVSVTLLVVALLVSRGAVRRLLYAPESG